MPNLHGKVCLVTGASRGIGRGIAIQLATSGAVCYITGRNKETLDKVQDEVKKRGSTGKVIPVECDHSNDKSIEELFTQIEQEQNKLDLLVNNAYAGVQYIMDEAKKPFWDQPTEGWDYINNVGLRNHFICSQFASRLMIPKRKGLIINISSIGGVLYFQTPAYGVGKAGKDRMARDCAQDLARYNVAYISMWPGPVRTELIQNLNNNPDADISKQANLRWLFENGESTEFAGKSIAYLLLDDNIMDRSGKIVWTTDLAREFDFKDIDGRSPVSMRSIKTIMVGMGMLGASSYVPEWLRLPVGTFCSMCAKQKNRQRKDPSKYE